MAISVSFKSYEKNKYFAGGEFQVSQKYKILFLINGNATYQDSSGNNISFSSGEAILIVPFEPHRLSGTFSKYYEVYFEKIDVSSDFLPEFYAIFKKTVHVNLGERKNMFLLDMEKLLNEFLGEKKYKMVAMWSVLQNILVGFVRAFKSGYNTKNDGFPIMNVIDFIDKNYDKKITVEDMAKIALMSKSHFSCKFKKYMGVTPNEYLNKTRISVATKYVCVSGMTISDVAHKVGMCSESYFCSMFKKYMKMSPKKYGELVNTKIVLYDFGN